jgi:hypothetical protein
MISLSRNSIFQGKTVRYTVDQETWKRERVFWKEIGRASSSPYFFPKHTLFFHLSLDVYMSVSWLEQVFKQCLKGGVYTSPIKRRGAGEKMSDLRNEKRETNKKVKN